MAPVQEQKPPYLSDHLLNFRDVGSTINTFTKSPSLNTGKVYRSGRLDGTSSADHAYLRKTLGIKTVLDLRSKTEKLAAARKHVSSTSSPVTGSVTRHQSLRSAPYIPGIRYAEVNLNGGAFERALLWQLKYTSLLRLLWLMARGEREDAISILGREVMLPRGLIGLAFDTLQYSTGEIKDVFDILADENNYPLLVHCTQGKDRTGMVVLLLLMLCRVDEDAIEEDYMISEKELLIEKEDILQAIFKIGLSEDFAKCPEQFAKEVTKHVRERYGGIEDYLTAIGIDVESQQRVRRIMLQNPTH